MEIKEFPYQRVFTEKNGLNAVAEDNSSSGERSSLYLDTQKQAPEVTENQVEVRQEESINPAEQTTPTRVSGEEEATTAEQKETTVEQKEIEESNVEEASEEQVEKASKNEVETSEQNEQKIEEASGLKAEETTEETNVEEIMPTPVTGNIDFLFTIEGEEQLTLSNS